MLNHIDLMGRLTRDPERKNKSNESSIVRFALACQRNHADQNGDYGVDFFDIVAFGKSADFAEQYFRKGQLICVEGHLTLRAWKDSDGCKRKSVSIVAERLHFADRRPERGDELGARELEPGSETPYSPADYYELPADYEVGY